MNLLKIATIAVDEHDAMQKPTELAAFLAIACALEPAVVWEIGTAAGGTLWALVRALGGAPTYASIDLPGGAYGGAQCLPARDLRDLLRSAGAKHLDLVRGDSRTVGLPATPRPDLVIIDGDHSYAGVRADWQRFARLVAPGGLVALHDVLEHPPAAGVDVHRFWSELVASPRATVEIADRRPGPAGGQWGGWGIVMV